MSNLTKTLLEIALSPYPQKKYAWVSEVEEGPYHIETTASAAEGGQTFRAKCGASGDFNFSKGASAILAYQKCATCHELSTNGILDVGIAVTAGDSSPATKGQCADSGTGGGVPAQAPPLEKTRLSLAFKNPTFIERIERVCDVSPLSKEQARLEEIDAEREGAAMEASGYQDPANGRHQ